MYFLLTYTKKNYKSEKISKLNIKELIFLFESVNVEKSTKRIKMVLHIPTIHKQHLKKWTAPQNSLQPKGLLQIFKNHCKFYNVIHAKKN